MKKIIKITFIICLLFIGKIQAQTTIDYSTFYSDQCNVFNRFDIYVSDILHETTIGQVTKGSTAINLTAKYDPISPDGVNKGTEFQLKYPIKQNYSYKIVVRARNVGSYNRPADLKLSIGQNGGPTGSTGSTWDCTGAKPVTGVSSNSKKINRVAAQEFNNYEVNFDNISTASNYLRLAALFENELPSAASLQIIEIEKITITETPPTPYFTLSSPNTLEIPCGSTTPITFIVKNVYNSPGDFMCLWEVGSGWNRTGTFYTDGGTMTLTPTGVGTPSYVRITPILSNAYYPEIRLTPTLAPFTSNSVIQGNTAPCPNSDNIYRLNTVNSVQWRLSNNALGTITSGANASSMNLRINNNATGTLTIFAKESNTCGQSIEKSFNIVVGAPTFQGRMQGDSNPLVETSKSYSVPEAIGATRYEWFIDYANVLYKEINGWKIEGSDSGKVIRVTVGNVGVVVVCRAYNHCGYNNAYIYVTPRKSTDPCPDRFKIALQNPIKAGESITAKPKVINDPCNNIFNPGGFKSSAKESNTVANNINLKVYDFYGQLVYQETFETTEFSTNKANLKSGKYIVIISDSTGKSSKEILLVD